METKEINGRTFTCGVLPFGMAAPQHAMIRRQQSHPVEQGD